MKYLLIFVLLFCSTLVFADGFNNTISGSVKFNYIGVIEQKIPEWMDITTHLALKIFTILWVFETFNQLVFKHVLGNNMKQLPTYFITRICFAGFFAYVMLKPEFYLGVIQFIGSKTTGVTFDNNTIHGLDVGWVFKQFKNWDTYVYLPQQDSLSWGIQSFTYAFMYVIYLACTCIITLMMIILEVEIYLTVFGALILTGFAGSSWTFGIWNRYLDTVIGLGVRVLVFGMLFGLFKVLIYINPASAGIMSIINSAISITLTTACLYIIPNKLARIVSGSAAGHSLGEAIGLGIGTMATAGYMAGKVADMRHSIPSLGGGGSDTSNKNDLNTTNPSDPLNTGGAVTPVPERMPPNWKPGDN